MVQLLWKPGWQFLKKLKIELLCEPAIPLLGIYPEEWKAGTQTDICTPMFTAAQFTQVASGSQVSMDERMDRKNMVHLYNGVLLRCEKEKKILEFPLWLSGLRT